MRTVAQLIISRTKRTHFHLGQRLTHPPTTRVLAAGYDQEAIKQEIAGFKEKLRVLKREYQLVSQNYRELSYASAYERAERAAIIELITLGAHWTVQWESEIRAMATIASNLASKIVGVDVLIDMREEETMTKSLQDFFRMHIILTESGASQVRESIKDQFAQCTHLDILPRGTKCCLSIFHDQEETQVPIKSGQIESVLVGVIKNMRNNRELHGGEIQS